MEVIVPSDVGNVNQKPVVTIPLDTVHKDVMRTGRALDVMLII